MAAVDRASRMSCQLGKAQSTSPPQPCTGCICYWRWTKPSRGRCRSFGCISSSSDQYQTQNTTRWEVGFGVEDNFQRRSLPLSLEAAHCCEYTSDIFRAICIGAMTAPAVTSRFFCLSFWGCTFWLCMHGEVRRTMAFSACPALGMFASYNPQATTTSLRATGFSALLFHNYALHCQRTRKVWQGGMTTMGERFKMT